MSVSRGCLSIHLDQRSNRATSLALICRIYISETSIWIVADVDNGITMSGQIQGVSSTVQRPNSSAEQASSSRLAECRSYSAQHVNTPTHLAGGNSSETLLRAGS